MLFQTPEINSGTDFIIGENPVLKTIQNPSKTWEEYVVMMVYQDFPYISRIRELSIFNVLQSLSIYW